MCPIGTFRTRTQAGWNEICQAFSINMNMLIDMRILQPDIPMTYIYIYTSVTLLHYTNIPDPFT